MDGTTVAVAGGGVAGLVAARHLAERGASVTVYERTEQVGGRVGSSRHDGHVCDAGFQVLFDAYPAARRELDYEALDLRRFAPGATICRPNSRTTLADPLRDPGAAVETLLGRAITTGDKVRTARLRQTLGRRSGPPAYERRGEDRTIEQYLRDRGFSERYLDRFARPFYGGITLDRSLDSSALVFEFTFRMLVAGRAAVPAAGMGAIPAQLASAARAAGAEIVTDADVEALGPDGDGATLTVDGDDVTADAAVVATDPWTARDLTDVGAIPSESRGCVTQYYTLGGSGLDAGGRILLNAAGGDPNQVVPVSAVAPEHAAGDATLLSATFLGAPDADEAALAERTRATLADWYPERTVGDLSVVHTARIPRAQFPQPPGVFETLPDATDPDGPVYLAGDYTVNCSINGALESGRRAARAAAADC
ncbi:MAG: NAD(P)/FAD-dependent oxidoreductase [Halobacteriaceae archaeon]